MFSFLNVCLHVIYSLSNKVKWMPPLLGGENNQNPLKSIENLISSKKCSLDFSQYVNIRHWKCWFFPLKMHLFGQFFQNISKTLHFKKKLWKSKINLLKQRTKWWFLNFHRSNVFQVTYSPTKVTVYSN